MSPAPPTAPHSLLQVTGWDQFTIMGKDNERTDQLYVSVGLLDLHLPKQSCFIKNVIS